MLAATQEPRVDPFDCRQDRGFWQALSSRRFP
jgi:hypothetical protein